MCVSLGETEGSLYTEERPFLNLQMNPQQWQTSESHRILSTEFCGKTRKTEEACHVLSMCSVGTILAECCTTALFAALAAAVIEGMWQICSSEKLLQQKFVSFLEMYLEVGWKSLEKCRGGCSLHWLMVTWANGRYPWHWHSCNRAPRGCMRLLRAGVCGFPRVVVCEAAGQKVRVSWLELWWLAHFQTKQSLETSAWEELVKPVVRKPAWGAGNPWALMLQGLSPQALWPPSHLKGLALPLFFSSLSVAEMLKRRQCLDKGFAHYTGERHLFPYYLPSVDVLLTYCSKITAKYT